MKIFSAASIVRTESIASVSEDKTEIISPRSSISVISDEGKLLIIIALGKFGYGLNLYCCSSYMFLGRFPKVRIGRLDHGRTNHFVYEKKLFPRVFDEKPSPLFMVR